MNNGMEKEMQWLLKEKYKGKLTTGAKKDIKRLETGEPVDYVIGFSDFLGCKIDLSKRPLIPRQETEFWVQKAIDQMNSPSTRSARLRQNLRVLDMFSGSGCVGVAILKHIKNSKLVFAEKDKQFIKQIHVNCKINGIDKKRYKITQSDIFSKTRGAFDYIVANPPYIPTKRKGKIQKSVLRYEPRVALFGGGDGLLYIRKFLAEAKNFLDSDGKIYMEFDSPQKPRIVALLKKYGYSNYEFHKDQYGKWRYITCQKGVL